MKRFGVFLGVITLAILAHVSVANAQVFCTQGDVVPVNAAKVCWTNATTDVSGVTLPATGVGSLKTTRLQHIRMGTIALGCDFAAPADPIETKDFPPTTGGFYFENLADGKHCFRARHINNEGLMSDWSAVVSKNVTAPKPPGKPNAPSVTVDYAPSEEP